MLQYTDDFNHICMTYNVNTSKIINELKFNFCLYMKIYTNEDENIWV